IGTPETSDLDTAFDRRVIGQISPKRKRALPYPRESNETPRENAFCLVAPTVRLSDFAFLPAGVFFKSRISTPFHARCFALPAIKISDSDTMQAHIDLVAVNVNDSTSAMQVQSHSSGVGSPLIEEERTTRLRCGNACF